MVIGTPSLMIAELCRALTIEKAMSPLVTVPPMFIGSILVTPWPPRCMQISNIATTVASCFWASLAASPT